MWRDAHPLCYPPPWWGPWLAIIEALAFIAITLSEVMP